MTYLITGANRGLGLELVREGAERGVEIIATCRRTGEELPRLAGKFKGSVFIQEMDVADTCSVKQAFKNITKKFSNINGLLNNAAVLYGSKYDHRDPITSVDIGQCTDICNINVLGVIRVLKYFMPLIYVSTGDRCVINISTQGAILQDTGYFYATYCASKSMLNHYTQSMRNYFMTKKDKSDIRVYMIHPGCMYTDMGVENAQIQPSESARGIWDIIQRHKDMDRPIPFYDYKGKYLL
jgi:NAD(P)-dependent dehydrogenase (short-subunit alcohol dehydrogenase family)